jgi:hypothetical protein
MPVAAAKNDRRVIMLISPSSFRPVASPSGAAAHHSTIARPFRAILGAMELAAFECCRQA